MHILNYCYIIKKVVYSNYGYSYSKRFPKKINHVIKSSSLLTFFIEIRIKYGRRCRIAFYLKDEVNQHFEYLLICSRSIFRLKTLSNPCKKICRSSKFKYINYPTSLRLLVPTFLIKSSFTRSLTLALMVSSLASILLLTFIWLPP